MIEFAVFNEANEMIRKGWCAESDLGQQSDSSKNETVRQIGAQTINTQDK